MARIEIREETCTGCGACVPACPFGAISVSSSSGLAIIDPDRCNLCGACEESCPFEAIIIRKGSGQGTPDSGSYRGILVVGEQREGVVDHSTLELLGAARRLSEADGSVVSVLLMTAQPGEWPSRLIAGGADVVLLAEHPCFSHYLTEPCARLLEKVILTTKPAVVLAAATTTGRDLMPRVAARIDTGLTADCTALEIDGESGLLLQTRPAFGGNIMATILCERTRPQMATVRPRVMKALEPEPGREGRVEKLELEPGDPVSRVELLDFTPLEEGAIDITESETIVSGGRGMKSPESFPMLQELADLLDGSVGASRAAVDAGWVPYPHQVGQTGKTVQPRTYVACGISGAVQHLVGMQSSDRIYAINRDPRAPIFQVCTEGFVGDLFEILPALARELRRRRGEAGS
ncbi:electron transfer flavoprotein subunit alpha [Candidatus Fermentibacterales bacterium]|nr:electron transfer flavoprotein subunit alpha [Candidatus Fermentibacterales bacterium]